MFLTKLIQVYYGLFTIITILAFFTLDNSFSANNQLCCSVLIIFFHCFLVILFFIRRLPQVIKYIKAGQALIPVAKEVNMRDKTTSLT